MMRDPTKIAAYSYQRFSSAAQSAGDSVIRQSSLAAAYAAQHGLHLDDQLTIRDLGISGYRGENATQGNLARFLTAVRDGQIAEGSFLLIESLDRLSRANILQAQNILTELILAKINVVSLVDQRTYSIDSLADDPLGLIFAIIVFIRANEESALKSMRARQAWIRKREAAATTVMSSRLPDWLKRDEATGAIIPIPDRAKLLINIFQAASRGFSASQIAADLNRRCIPRWRGTHEWTRPTVATLLANRRVTGLLPLYVFLYEDGKERRRPIGSLPGYFPRIIAPDAFIKIQALNGGRRSGGNAAKCNLFANMLLCANCHSAVRHHTLGREGRAILACDAARLQHRCSAPEIDYERFELAAIYELARWIREDLPWRHSSDDGLDISALIEQIARCDDALPNSHRQDICQELAMPIAESAAFSQELDNILYTESKHNKVLFRQASFLLGQLESGLPDAASRVKCNRILRRLCSRMTVDCSERMATIWKSCDVQLSWNF